jgi:hypothetical protein
MLAYLNAADYALIIIKRDGGNACAYPQLSHKSINLTELDSWEKTSMQINASDASIGFRYYLITFLIFHDSLAIFGNVGKDCPISLNWAPKNPETLFEDKE